MGLKVKIRNALRRPSAQDKAVLRHTQEFAKFLTIGIKYTDIVDHINAFDWLEITSADSEEAMGAIILKFFKGFNFEYPPAYGDIVLRAFAHKFTQAIEYLREAIEETKHSYNVEGSSRGFTNPAIDKLYYISYWADKKNIPVNFNEKDQAKRDLFNLDTIILSILADKLAALNAHERAKQKQPVN